MSTIGGTSGILANYQSNVAKKALDQTRIEGAQALQLIDAAARPPPSLGAPVQAPPQEGSTISVYA